MKEMICDFRGVEEELCETWADCPDRQTLEALLAGYAGKVIKVKVTLVRRPPRR